MIEFDVPINKDTKINTFFKTLNPIVRKVRTYDRGANYAKRIQNKASKTKDGSSENDLALQWADVIGQLWDAYKSSDKKKILPNKR